MCSSAWRSKMSVEACQMHAFTELSHKALESTRAW